MVESAYKTSLDLQFDDKTSLDPQFDVSAVVRLRKRLARAATSLKFMGLWWAVDLAVSGLLLYRSFGILGVGIALVCGLALVWCAFRIARLLRSGSKRAAMIAAAWSVLWACVAFLFVQRLLGVGNYRLAVIVIGLYSPPIYFLSRGLFAFTAHRAWEVSSPSTADPLALNPWEEGPRIKMHPKFVNKASVPAYILLLLSLYLTLGILYELVTGKWIQLEGEDECGVVWYSLAFISVAFGTLVLAAHIYRRARRNAMLPGGELVKRDKRPPILYLRSFQDDSIKLRARATHGRVVLETLIKISFEEVVTDKLWTYGPVLAISDPLRKDKLVPLGAARDYVTYRSWQEDATDLMRRASMIVVIVGATEGVGWELDTIMRLGFRTKLVLLLPPMREETLNLRWRSLRSNSTSADLPSQIDLVRTLAVVFPEGRTVPVTGDRRDDWTYEAALDEAALVTQPEREDHARQERFNLEKERFKLDEERLKLDEEAERKRIAKLHAWADSTRVKWNF
jgi:hypothetical protein